MQEDWTRTDGPETRKKFFFSNSSGNYGSNVKQEQEQVPINFPIIHFNYTTNKAF